MSNHFGEFLAPNKYRCIDSLIAIKDCCQYPWKTANSHEHSNSPFSLISQTCIRTWEMNSRWMKYQIPPSAKNRIEQLLLSIVLPSATIGYISFTQWFNGEFVTVFFRFVPLVIATIYQLMNWSALFVGKSRIYTDAYRKTDTQSTSHAAFRWLGIFLKSTSHLFLICFFCRIVFPFPFICRNLHFASHSVIRTLFAVYCSWASIRMRIHLHMSEGATSEKPICVKCMRYAQWTLSAATTILRASMHAQTWTRTTSTTSSNTDAGTRHLCGWFLWPKYLIGNFTWDQKKRTRKVLITIRSMQTTLFGHEVTRIDAVKC